MQIAVTLTTAAQRIDQMTTRYRPVQGGTSAAKTYSILYLWILKALNYDPKFAGINSIVAESLPHLKRGAMRDFFEIVDYLHIYNENDHNKTDKTYKINDSVFEFFAADDSSKLRGGRRLNLFINEMNNIPQPAYDELEVRTKYNIWGDWNPVADFYGMHLGVEPIVLTYRDNEMLDDNIIRSIESRKGNDSWYKVYGLGMVGTLEGVVYNNWEAIDKVPEDAQLLGSGLDFGFTNDPTAAVTVYRYDGELIVNEILYQKGLTNREIALKLKPLDTGVIYADSAEPKSISEIRTFGIRMIGAKKGRDSVMFGIDLLKDYKIRPTKNSINLIKALRNYSWDKDKNGNYINKPNHAFSDILDGLRYFAVMELNKTRNNYAIV